MGINFSRRNVYIARKKSEASLADFPVESSVKHAAHLVFAQRMTLQSLVVTSSFNGALFIEVVHSLNSFGKRLSLGLASTGAAPEWACHLFDYVRFHGVRQHQLDGLRYLRSACGNAQCQCHIAALRGCVLESVLFPGPNYFRQLSTALTR